MKKQYFSILGLSFALLSFGSHATVCPDPQTTSLKWGVPPAPWVVNPYSSNPPQGDESTRFARANILVAGYYGVGVTCTYRNTSGDYSIWRQVQTKVPAPVDYNWISTQGGFVCTQGLNECTFSIAE